jgi:hypothetical protein
MFSQFCQHFFSRGNFDVSSIVVIVVVVVVVVVVELVVTAVVENIFPQLFTNH